MQALSRTIILVAFLLSACGQNDQAHSGPEATSGPAETPRQPSLLKDSLTGAHRKPSESARDRYRHPAETLAFFEIQPEHHVIELWPGSGWYTAVLAPVLRGTGKLIAASFAPGGPAYRDRIHAEFVQRLADTPEVFAEVEVLRFGAEGYFLLGPDNSADRVLTFRNTHNWIKAGIDEEVYNAAFRVLKPGGILGVVQHRAEDDADARQRAITGYVPEPYVIDTATAAGFELIASAEINANPRDVKAYPEGVWTLPPSLRLKDKDRKKYLEIGESDRMTLKFRKPHRGG